MALGLGGLNPLQARAKNTGLAAALSKNAATVATHAWYDDGKMEEMESGMEIGDEKGGCEQSGEVGKRGIYKRERGPWGG